MRETKFIEQNQEKWADIEEMLRQNHRDPEKLNELFIQITDDLSYARTYYPNRSVRMYLNGLAQQIFYNIYRGKRLPARRFREFWTVDLPREMWESRKALILSFCIFALACTIGVVSSIIDPDFARVIMGDDYVEMTLRNIGRNDPMAVYKESQPLGMSMGIAANNLFVALRAAVLGVLASIGTVFMLLHNGIMIGTFQYFFIEKDLFWESFLTIWVHGTLEISALIIAGAAGLVAGSGLLFPGTYSRGQAFGLSMRRGLKIFIGLIPVFVLAAFFEGYLTRYTETPSALRFMFILSSLAFVLWYFVWLPWHKKRVGAYEQPLREQELPPTREQVISFTAIKHSGEIFSDVFTLLKRQARVAWGGACLASVLYTSLAAFSVANGEDLSFVFINDLTGAFQGWWTVFSLNRAPIVFLGQVVLFWGLFGVGLYMVQREMPPAFRELWRGRLLGGHLVVPLLVSFGLVWLLSAVESGEFLWFVSMLIFPLLTLWMAVAYFEKISWQSIPRVFALMRWGPGMILGFLVINFAFLLFLFIDSPIWALALEYSSWLLPPEESAMELLLTYATAFAVSLIAHWAWLLLVLSGMLQFFSSLEQTDAWNLHEGIEEVGTSRQIRGLTRE